MSNPHVNVNAGSDFGLIAPGITMGAARTTQEPTAGFYGGFILATGGLFKTVGLVK